MTDRDPVDLLVYGTGDLEQLTRRWPAAITALGATVTPPDGFALARHAGRLATKLTLGEGPLATTAASQLQAGGELDAAFELFLEPLSAVSEELGGLEQVPAEAATRIRSATFCAVISVAASASAASCLAAWLTGVALARVADGVLADIAEERYWLPDEAIADADRYLVEVLTIGRR